MSNEFTFTGTSGKLYDLYINFLIAKKLEGIDFSSVTDKPVKILDIASNNIPEFYNDMPLLAGIAWGITWIKDSTNGNAVDVQEHQNEFLSNIDGTNFDSLRNALWNSLANFFPQLANDFLRVQTIQRAGQEEAERQNQILTDMGTKSVITAVQTIAKEAARRITGRESSVS